MKLGLQIGLSPGHIVLDGDPGLPPPKGHSPQFSTHICCGQMARWIKMPLGLKVCLDPSDIALDGFPAPPPQKRAEPPQFSAHAYFGQTAVCIKKPLGMQVSLDPSDIVLDGDPAALPKRAPNFRPMSIVAKRLDQARVPLSMEVGLGPGHIVLHGDPAPPPKRSTALHFSAHVYCGQTVAHLSYCRALVNMVFSDEHTILIKNISVEGI